MWVQNFCQENCGYKGFKSEKNLVQKNLGPKNTLVKRSLVQKKCGEKKFRSKENLVKKNLGQKVLGIKDSLVQKRPPKIGSKKFGQNRISNS